MSSEFIKLQAQFILHLNSIISSYSENGNASNAHLTAIQDLITWLEQADKKDTFLIWILGTYIGLLTVEMTPTEIQGLLHESNMQQLELIDGIDDLGEAQ